MIDFLKPTKYTPWLEELKKGALQDKGVCQIKKFHLEDGGNLQDEVLLQFKKIPMTDFYQHLPKQVTKGKGDLGNIHVSPNHQSLDYQVNTDVTPGVLASREVLADNYENDNKDRASNTPPVNDPEDKLDLSTASNSKASKADSSGHPNDSREVLAENSDDDDKERASKMPPVNDPKDKLHSSTASNSKTSMADSSGHPNDAGKKAAATARVPHLPPPPRCFIIK